MQSNMKSNSLITSRVSAATFDVTITIPQSVFFTVRGIGELEADLTKWSVENLSHSCIHGAMQRVPDAAAIPTNDPEDGSVIPADVRTRMKHLKMARVISHYETGTAEWNLRSAGEGAGSLSITVEAFARVQKLTYAEADTRINTRAEQRGVTRKAQLKLISDADAVKAAILAIRLERDAARASSVDANGELDAIMAGE